MTINKNEQINLPKWLVIFLLPILIGAFSGFASSMFTMGKKTQMIETLQNNAIENKNAIKQLKDNDLKDIREQKADKEVVEKIYNSLIRIESKFDQHIAK